MLAGRGVRSHRAYEVESGRQGFVLISAAIAIIAVMGLLGLAIDVGRMYVIKSELQTWSDAAAIAAAYALDGTAQGITKATQAVQNGNPSVSNRWNFGTQTITNAQAGFATAAAGPFVSNPVSAAGVRFAQVTVSETVPVYFLPVLPSIGTSVTVSATSTAGQLSQTSLGDGLSPFSPDAHNTADPNFGFTVGQLYTLRWPPPGKRGKAGNSCAGDGGYSPAGANDRGYVDIGQGNGNSGLDSAIVDNNYTLASPLTIGSTLSMVSGQKNTSTSIQTRVDEDTDTTSSTYSSYTGNGRRVIVVPVNNGSDPALVVGFAAFFLPPSPCGAGNTSPCCAEYIGPAVAFANHPGGANSGGLFKVQLIQ